jgi:hypothetical protein
MSCDHSGAWFHSHVWPMIGLDRRIQEIDQIKPRTFTKKDAWSGPHMNRVVLFNSNQGLVSILLYKYICGKDSENLNEIHFASQDISCLFRYTF